MQHISLVNSDVSLNIEGSKYTVSSRIQYEYFYICLGAYQLLKSYNGQGRIDFLKNGEPYCFVVVSLRILVEGFRYSSCAVLLFLQISMVRGGPGSYRLRMNESEIEAEIHTLRDGGLLMQARVFSIYSFLLFPTLGIELLLVGSFYCYVWCAK